MKFISNVSRQLTGWLSTRSNSASAKNAPEIHLQSLEDRVLYSAAPVPVEMLTESHSVDANYDHIEQQMDLLNEAVEQLQQDSVDDGQLRLDENEYSIEPLANVAVSSQTLQELVIIDQGVEGWEALRDDVLANNESGNVIVKLIDTSIDGVEEITRLLEDAAAEGTSYSALHIVSHGDAGEIRLGNTVLDSDSIADYSHEISQWQDSLAFEADILIYGCDLAADENGESLVDEISELSGANVAASDDLTGHASLGGDWDLEYTAGTIDSEVVFSVSLIDSWNQTLNTGVDPMVIAAAEPVAIDTIQRGLENFGVRFAPTDFGLPANHDPLAAIHIESLPEEGQLIFNDSAITQADIDASSDGFEIEAFQIGGLRYLGPADVFGENIAEFQYSVNDGVQLSLSPATVTLTLAAEDRLWISTAGDSSTIPGNGNGALQLGGPILSFGEDTDGFWSQQFTPAGIAIDAVHYVDENIQIGGQSSRINFNRGDILFSASPSGPSVTGVLATPGAIGTGVSDDGQIVEIMAGDIVRFRPFSGDYSSGSYEIVARVEQLYDTVPTDYDITALTLVDQDTVIGDQLVKAGDLLISDTVNPGDILLLQLDATGTAPTGNLTLLIEGAEIGINGQLTGLEVIEAQTTAGGQVLPSGSILASVASAENVGSAENLAVEAQDIFVLDVASTSYHGEASADASIFFDGSDVGGDAAEADSAVDAVALLGNPDVVTPDLTALQSNISLEENEVFRFTTTDFVSSATAENLESVVITSLPDPAKATLTFRGQDVIVGQVISVDDLGLLLYQPLLDFASTNDEISFRAVSSAEILIESRINFQATSTPDDVTIGGGTELHPFFSNDEPVAAAGSSDRVDPQITALTGGGYVIQWLELDGSDSEIYLQQYDADHVKVGSVKSFADGEQGSRSQPSVAALSDGGFIVVGTSDRFDGSGEHIYAERYDAAGQAVDLLDSGNSGVNGNAVGFEGSGQQSAGDVVGLQDGAFVIAAVDDSGSNTSVVGKVIYNGDVINEFDISQSLTATGFADVSLVATNNGGFAAAWIGSAFDGMFVSVYARYFDANGFPTSPLVSLATTEFVDSPPSISILKDNSAIIVWGETSTGDPAGDFRLAGAIVNEDGTVDPTGEKPIAYDSKSFDPDVIALNDGGFLVATSDAGIDGSAQSIVAHHFDASFERVGTEEIINQDVAGSQSSPELALLAGQDEIVAVWNTEGLGTAADLVTNSWLFEATAPLGEPIPLNLSVEALAGVGETINNNIEITNLPLEAELYAESIATGELTRIFGTNFDQQQFKLDTLQIVLPIGTTEAEFLVSAMVQENGATERIEHRFVARSTGTAKTISGTVFNDENANGLINEGTVPNAVFEDVTVHLYKENAMGVREKFGPSVTTDQFGHYEFTGLGQGTYFVIVDSTSIGQHESDAQYRVWAEQTYGGEGAIKGGLNSAARSAGALFGGRFGDVSDNPFALDTSEHVNRQTLTLTDTEATAVDFGFSFNAVTNVEDSINGTRTVQGSFRQFIENANHVIGDNHMRFVPAVEPNRSTNLAGITGSELWWSIDVVHELPEIISSGTTIDGQAWRPTDTGLESRDLNDFTVEGSYTGTVGTNGIAFLETDAPELELVGESSFAHGILIIADQFHAGLQDVEVSNLSIHGFGNNPFDAAIRITGGDSSGLANISDVRITGNVLGSAPNDLESGIESRTAENFKGIYVTGAVDGLISNNIIVGNTSGGIQLDGFAEVKGWTIENNEIGLNGQLLGVSDGIDSTDVSNAYVYRNAIYGAAGNGVDQYSENGGSGGWIIEDNSIFENGIGGDYEGSGIRLTGDGSTVRYNQIVDNQYDGVTVSGYFDLSSSAIVPGEHNLISQNSFEGNGQDEIDLLSDAFDGLSFFDFDTNGDGDISASEAFGSLAGRNFQIANVFTADDLIQLDEANEYFAATLGFGGGSNADDGVANSNSSNNGLDAPDVISAEFSANNLVVTLTITNPDVEEVELYIVNPDGPSSQAWQYFETVPVSSMTLVGTDTYQATLPASDFPAGVSRDTPVLALGIDSLDNTSEFGTSSTPIVGNSVPEASFSSVSTLEEQSYTFSFGDFGSSDPDFDAITDIIISTLPSPLSGQLLLGGTEVVAGQRIQAALVSNLTFEPAENFFGSTLFQFAVSDGELDSVPAAMTIIVENVGDAPVGRDANITVLEDGVFNSFDENTFGFEDPTDDNLDSFATVEIVSFTGSGTLTTSMGDATGRTLSVAELAELEYRPGLNDNGAGIATIEFRVVDTGTGDNISSTNKLTFDVTPVADNPKGTSQSLAINEDEIVTFTPASFGFSDVDGDAFSAVRFVGLNGSGTVTFDGAVVAPGTVIQAADLPRLQFQPGANDTGSDISRLEFRVIDNGSGNNEEVLDQVLLYDVLPASDAPVGQDDTISVDEDSVLKFTESTFGFSDPNDTPADTFKSVRIVSFVGSGKLTFNDADVTPNQTISTANLADLEYRPAQDENGPGLATIKFLVIDSGTVGSHIDTDVRGLTIDVDPVHDAPTGVSSTVSIVEDGVLNFAPRTFGFSDAIDNDADKFAAVRIVDFIGNGILEINGNPVFDNQTISVGDLPNLEYKPLPNDNGNGLATIEFRVLDFGSTNNEDLQSRFLTIDVTPASDAPTGQNDTITIDEDSVLYFDETTFGFSDAIDSDADTFEGVRIVSFAGSGTLTLDGVAVTTNQIVSAADLPLLAYQPASNDNGNGLATIQFRVIDSGTTGSQVDTTVRELTVDVVPTSDSPTGTTQSVTIDEDTVLTFDETTFGFSDPLDNPADSFAGVRIGSFSGNGILTLNGVEISPMLFISAADLPNLAYTPPADEYGDGLATIRFRVFDDGSDGPVADQRDEFIRDLTINVAPVSDAPTGVSQTVAVDEDGVLTFDETVFGFSDPIDGNSDSFEGVRVVSFGGNGTLELNGVAVASDTVVSAADLPDLQYRPAPNANGIAEAFIDFRVIDGGTINNEDVTVRMLTIDVNPQSDAPVGRDGTVTIDEDTTLNFTDTTFGFSDPLDGDNFNGVRIVSFGGGGTLTLDGTTVTPNQFVLAADLPNLEYQPPADANGNGLATIQFRVIDDGSVGSQIDTTVRELTINVTPVDDNPTGVSQTVTINEDQLVTFTPASFGFEDNADNDVFDGVRIVAFNGSGTLTLNGATVAPLDVVSAADLASLEYQPAANANGNGLSTIAFQVIDTGVTNNEDLTIRSLTYDVTPTSDAPTGQSNTMTIAEDSVLDFFDETTFGFSDDIDNDADAFAGVRIVSLLGSGTLKLDGVDVTSNQIISGADLADLKYQPGANDTGNGIATIRFRVFDSGTTGAQFDETVRELSINVTPVSDFPVGHSGSVTIIEDAVLNFDETTFGFSDPLDNPADGFAGVQIVSLNGEGTLTVAGIPITTSTYIPAADLPNLEYEPDEHANGNGIATIKFRVADDGELGRRLDPTVRELTINVTPVHDAPVGNPDNAVVDEDGVLNFTEAMFGFSDPVDGDAGVADNFESVRIVTFDGSGTLELNGTTVSDGDVVAAADIPNLEYRPAANENGVGLASVDYRVIDDGAANNEDVTTRTLTIDVTPQSDSPVGQDDTITIDEDSVLTFDETTFGFSDSIDFGADRFTGVAITGFTGSGSLELNGVPLSPTEFVRASELPFLTYQPGLNDSGDGIATIRFRVRDSGTPGDRIDEFHRELTINVTPIGETPTGSSQTIRILEDETYSFISTDFGFSDVDGDLLESVRIVDFAGSGTLTLNGVDVSANEVVLLADITNLQYQPGANENGSALAAVTFRVIDDGSANNEDLDDRTLTFDVQRVDDRPTGTSQSLTAIEDQPFTFSESEFGYDAVDGTDFASVRIVDFSGSGTLTLDGTNVSPNTIIEVDDLPRLTYRAGQDEFGPALSHIDFRVIDASNELSEDATTRTLTMNVTPVADAPTGQSGTLTTSEDSILSFDETNFGFSDAIDDNANSFTGVRIVSFTGNGRLLLNSVEVTPNQIIDFGEIPGLEYEPAANDNGVAVASIEFRVIDDGATNNESAIETLTIDVTTEHDAPVGSSGNVEVDEDGVLNFTEATFGFSDPVDNETDNFDGVRIIGFSGNGTLELNGVAVTADDVVSATDLPNLEYRPAANENGDGFATVDYRVIDDGATNNEDETTRILTIDVTPVSDAPTANSGTVAVAEDGVLNFTDSTFGFADAIDNDSFTGVRVVAFSGNGTLTLNGATVAANQVVSATDLANFEYRPATNDNGNGLATIDFRVIDGGSTNNESAVERLTIDVTSKHDAPVGNSSSVAVNEDGVLNFTETTFGFSDPVDSPADNFDGVRIVGFSGSGTLTLNGTAVSTNEIVSAADLPNLEYRPAANENGNAIATVDYRVIDDGSTNNEDVTTRNLTIDVTAVSDAPTGQDSTVTMVEDSILNFDETTFGFSDSIDNDVDSFTGVRIVSFSGSGTLELNGVAVTPNQIVTTADLPNLAYQPAANDNGNGIATISFRVIDSGDAGSQVDTTVRELTINVDAIADAPLGSSSTVAVAEDGVLNFTDSMFGFADPVDGNNFAGVRIVGFGGGGTLTLNGTSVAPNDVISATDLANLEYRPAANDNGSGLATIDFRVIDSGTNNNESTVVETLTIDVTAEHDAPVGSSGSVAIDEDGVLNFTDTTFGFSDPVDGGTDNFDGVRIIGFSGSGTLTLNGAVVPANDVVSATDLPNLEYRPAANENGNGLATVDYRVIDDGANNNEDTTTRILTIDVAAVSDAPMGQDDTITIVEDSVLNFDESTFGFSDSTDNDADSFVGVRIVSFSGSGALELNGVAVNPNQIITAADLPGLAYQPAANDAGNALAIIDFRVIDSGDPGNQVDATVRQLTINVSPTTEAPVGVSQTISIAEDSTHGFDSSDFGFSDVDGDSLAGVRIVDFAGDGTLTLNGSTVSPNDVVSVADLSNLEYQPGVNENGNALATVTFRVIDDGLSDNEDVDDRTITFDVSRVDDAPTGQSQTLTILEDETVTLSEESFGFETVDDDALAAVRIVGFTGSGTLTIDGAVVAANTVIDKDDLSRLTYHPGQDDYGNALSQVEFRVIDDSPRNNEDTTTRTLTFDVVEVNDAPLGTSSTLTTLEDQPLNLSAADFGFDDSVDNGIYQFEGVRIMDIMGRGSLQINGIDVVPGQLVPVNELGSLTYQPDGNDNGFGLSTIDFRVFDNGLTNNEDAVSRTLTIDVVSLDDAPTGQSQTLTINENETFFFNQSDFGFEDSEDIVPNNFAGVRIVGFGGSGDLTLSGIAVTPGQVIDVADLSNLEFTPGLNDSGDAISSVEFRVIDDGSTGSGEANEDLMTRVLTFDVLNVNDAPVVDVETFTNAENGILSHLISASDPNSDAFTLSLAGTDNDNVHFEISPDGQSVQFVSEPDFENPLSFNGGNTYFVDVQATDVHGEHSEIERIQIDVTNVVEAVQAIDDDDVLVVNNDSLNFSVFDNDNNELPIPEDATFQVVTQPDSGTVTINPDGTFEFSPTSITLENEVEFTYSVERGGEVTQADVTFVQAGGSGGGSNTGGGGPIDNGSSGSGDSSSDSTDEDNSSNSDELGDDTIDKDAIDSSLLNDDQKESTSTTSISGTGTNVIANTNGSGVNTLSNDIEGAQFQIDTGTGNTSSLYKSYAYSNFVDTALLTSELATRVAAAAKAGVQEFTEEFAFAAVFWQELDSASQDYVHAEVGEIETVIVAGGLFTTVAVGVFGRAFLLFGSLGATYAQPWWTSSFDLSSIIEEEDESIEQIVDNEN